MAVLFHVYIIVFHVYVIAKIKLVLICSKELTISKVISYNFNLKKILPRELFLSKWYASETLSVLI